MILDKEMDQIKDVLSQAGNLVQQAAHTVVEAIRGEETKKDEQTDQNKDNDDGKDKNIDSKQKKFEQEQDATLQKSPVAAQAGGYQDPISKSDAKVLPTSWPDLKGKTRHEAEEFIKAKGYSNIKVLKKGTCSSTEHDESRVILFVDDNDIVVEEPKVG